MRIVSDYVRSQWFCQWSECGWAESTVHRRSGTPHYIKEVLSKPLGSLLRLRLPEPLTLDGYGIQMPRYYSEISLKDLAISPHCLFAQVDGWHPASSTDSVWRDRLTVPSKNPSGFHSTLNCCRARGCHQVPTPSWLHVGVSQAGWGIVRNIYYVSSNRATEFYKTHLYVAI